MDEQGVPENMIIKWRLQNRLKFMRNTFLNLSILKTYTQKNYQNIINPWLFKMWPACLKNGWNIKFFPQFYITKSKIIQILTPLLYFLRFVDGKRQFKNLGRSKFDFNDHSRPWISIVIETLCTWSEKLVFTNLFMHPREYIDSIHRSVTVSRLQIKTRSSTFPQFYPGIRR